MKIPLSNRLSFRLTRLCILATFGVGVLISTAQILLDSRAESERMDQTVADLLEIVSQPATEAAYNIDPTLAQTVVDGLTENRGIYRASISIPPGEVLGEAVEPKATDWSRIFSDTLFDSQRYYHVKLLLPDGKSGIGDLHVYLDTYPQGQNFLARAGLVLFSGIVRAVILGLVLMLVFFLMLTRPLSRLVEGLSGLDPSQPGSQRLQTPNGHAQDEIGHTIHTTNNLLTAIEMAGRDKHKAEQEVSYLRQFDKLTDLPNRTLFYDRLTQSIRRARHDRKKVALLYCDVCQFQALNDQFGYDVGDKLLRNYALRLRSVAPVFTTVARLSGDQFGIMLDEIADATDAADLAQKIIDASNNPVEIDNIALKLQCDIGIALYPDDATAIDQLTQNAERALSIAKERGHDQYQFYIAELDLAVRERQKLEVDLREALLNDGLYVAYHPQFTSDSNRLVGAEALARWHHPERGMIPADEFITLAEESDLILELGEWVLQSVCKAQAKWLQQGLQVVPIAVNVSAIQLRKQALDKTVSAALSDHGLSPEHLQLEITETALLGDMEAAVQLLNRVQDLGIQLALDDFGTGHSSLNYLKRLPFNKLKIDKSFVNDLHDAGSKMILNAIINLGHSLRMTVLAEGVEEVEQLDYLRNHGCEQIQGFLLATPLTENDYTELLKTHSQPLEDHNAGTA